MRLNYKGNLVNTVRVNRTEHKCIMLTEYSISMLSGYCIGYSSQYGAGKLHICVIVYCRLETF